MSVGFTAILPEEFHALIGVSDKAFRLYLYLRQFMIRSNGTAAGAGVTWPDIARNGLYVAPGQGIQNSGMPDKRKMMRLRDELMRGGLIEDRGDHQNYLAFYFPIFVKNCDRYFSAQNKPAPIPHPKPAPIPHPETVGDTRDAGEIEPKATPTESGKPAPYTEVPNLSINQSDDGRFSMFANWEVSDFFGALAKRSMIDIKAEHQQLYAETVSEFMLFWMSPEAKEKYPHKACRSQQDWERALLQALLRAKAKPAKPLVPRGGYGDEPGRTCPPIKSSPKLAMREGNSHSHPSYKSVEDVRREAATSSLVDKDRDREAMRRLAAMAGVDPATLGVTA